MYNFGDYLSGQDLGMQIAVMAGAILFLIASGYSLAWVFRNTATNLGHAILGVIIFLFLAFVLGATITSEHLVLTFWLAIVWAFGYSLYPFRVRWPRLWSWIFGSRPTIQPDERVKFSGMRPADRYPPVGSNYDQKH